MENQDDITKLKTQVRELQEVMQECQLVVAELSVCSATDGENIKKMGETFAKLLEVVQNHDKVLQLLHAAMKALNAKFNSDSGMGQC